MNLLLYLSSIVKDKNGGHHRSQCHVIAQYQTISIDAIAIRAPWYDECDHWTEQAVQNTAHEFPDIKELIGQSGRIQFREFDAIFVGDVLFEDAER